ncbi:hypothetical protein JJV70_16870 [Streptomyces sp. JJ66]|uniref:hypothetical protein n=1 Tax=Streptomyces sp. JJ66 TaxID=2803843 RepID=UPI001C565418|nr:hypothetical protein [Streptomyces sp. JJ66]MBW1603750.1 hypothetical protein [Streptomyces sp. JJ66]
MNEATGAASGLPDAVQNVASAVASALAGGGNRSSTPGAGAAPAGGPSTPGAGAAPVGPAAVPGSLAAATGRAPDDPVLVACVRVLGADALAPALLHGTPPDPDDVALAAAARDAYPPGADATAATAWSHWGLDAALRALTGDGVPATAPDAEWTAGEPWPRLAFRMSQLASLALPGVDSALATAAAKRPVDLGRGFVRAVRRRDWAQAAGLGRWLALVPGVPPTLGLASGLAFVHHLGGMADARVALNVRAAQTLLGSAG